MKLEELLKYFSPQGIQQEPRDMSDVMDRRGLSTVVACTGSQLHLNSKGFCRMEKKSRLQYDDGERIMIDVCVARLKKYKPEEYELIVVRFVNDISWLTIAKKWKCSDGTTKKELQTAWDLLRDAGLQ